MTGQRDTDRERIRKAVGAVLANASNYPRGARPYILGQDIGPLVERTVTAVIAAVRREPGAVVLAPGDVVTVLKWHDHGALGTPEEDDLAARLGAGK